MAAVLVLVTLFSGGFRALASSAVPMSLRELAQEAGQVVLGEVVETRPRWAGGRIVTDVVLAVQRTLKGRAADRVTLEVLGGEVGDVGQRVHGEAAFRRGETVVVFLHERRELLRLRGAAGGSSPARRRLTVVGMAQGKLSVLPGRDGRLRVRRDLAGLELVGPPPADEVAGPSGSAEGVELERFLRSLEPHLRTAPRTTPPARPVTAPAPARLEARP
jgi:hypothetical protein